jgi:hypothetical protein
MYSRNYSRCFILNVRFAAVDGFLAWIISDKVKLKKEAGHFVYASFFLAFFPHYNYFIK